MSNPIREIAKLGQSIWYDQVRRALFTSGTLARMIEEAGFKRVTHRPLTGGIVAIHSGWKI